MIVTFVTLILGLALIAWGIIGVEGGPPHSWPYAAVFSLGIFIVAGSALRAWGVF